MSARLDDIDLNSEAVSVERNDEAIDVNISEPTAVRAGFSTAETLTGQPLGADGGDEGLMSVDRGTTADPVLGHAETVDAATVGDMSTSGEIGDGDERMASSLKDSIEEADEYGANLTCSENIENMNKSLISCPDVDRSDKSNAGGESKGKIDAIDGTPSSGLEKAGDAVLQAIRQKQNEDAGCALVFNLSPITHGHVISDSKLKSEGTEVHEPPRDVAVPVLDQLIEDTDFFIDRIGLNGNQDIAIKSQERDTELLQDTKENIKSDPKLEGQVATEGQFHVHDLVWAKVRSHPWWPGQIFDPSHASEKAKKYIKRFGLLIAYFGDQTFAWNEVSNIKPFRAHFSQMEKQSNSEAFCYAVDCALNEVSRRVEFGLVCRCLPEELSDKIKTQIFVNGGIREESNRREGGDNLSSVDSFMPVHLVQYVKELAESSDGGTEGLKFVIAQAQLLAFNRWKGYYELPYFKTFDGLLDNNVHVPVIEEIVPVSKGDDVAVSGKGKTVNQGSSSLKRKAQNNDGVHPHKKERRISDILSGSCSNLLNGGAESEEKAKRKPTSTSSFKKRKTCNSDDLEMKNRKTSSSPASKKQFLKVGESMRRVATQLATSPILRDIPRGNACDNGSNKRSSRDARKSQRRKVAPAQFPPPDEMLSQLCLAAEDPMKGYEAIIYFTSFFSDFRNSICLEKSTSSQHKKSYKKASDKSFKSPNSETTEASGFDGIEDFYWTDRIVQSNLKDQVLFEPETPTKEGNPAVERLVTIKLDSEAHCELENANANSDSGAKCEHEYSPTALILNFTELGSVPPVSNLNKIFSRFGPLNESETEVLKTSKRAKVIFKRRADAEMAFSSAGKFSIFGPALVSYRLTPEKSHSPKRSRRVAA